jgi:hypothetical protein
MPIPRRPSIRSPSIRKDRKVVMGTMTWLTMATDEGLAVFKAMKMKAKEPAPISRATAISRQNGWGTGRSQGKTASATTANRTAA